jgi:solute carrier family 39 (zinc transporter), member 1/2/3
VEHADAHGHGLGGHAAHGPEGTGTPANRPSNSDLELDVEKADTKGQGPSTQSSSHSHSHTHSHSHNHGSGHLGDSALAQLVGIAILEFGVLLHSVLIGLTLAVTGPDQFVVLFVVLVFHQTFEGLGLGSRLAYVELPPKYARLGPYVAALIFGVATPVGIAIGLGIRNTYAPEGATASIVAGILDALSAGILIYTGLVEVYTLSITVVMTMY